MYKQTKRDFSVELNECLYEFNAKGIRLQIHVAKTFTDQKWSSVQYIRLQFQISKIYFTTAKIKQHKLQFGSCVSRRSHFVFGTSCLQRN